MKVLIIFIKFSDDQLEESPITDLWPHTLNTLPTWAGDIISSTVLTQYSHPSMSGYYHEMSSGEYHVIGDVYENLYIPLHPQTYYYRSNSKGIHYVAEEIFTELDPHINYSKYDNDGPDGISRYDGSTDDDGIVDMILLCFRTFSTGNLDAVGSGYSGIASLSGKFSSFPSGESLTFDGVQIESGFPGSGTIQKDMYSIDQMNTLIHEFGHYLFGAIHYPHRRWGLMDYGVGCMTGFEREKLGWISYKTPTSSFEITDAISDDDIYSVPIPGSYYHYIIENRTGSSFYDSQWLNPYGELMTPGHGLLINKICNDIYYTQLESAEGKWDWLKSGSVYVYPFQQTNENPVSGKNELLLKDVYTTGGKKSHPDFLGDQEDLFTYTERNSFTPCTNPPSTTISILITDEDEDGNLTINYYPKSVFGDISDNQTWDENTLICGNTNIHNGIEICVEEDITVKKDVTLTVENGVTFKFASGKQLHVYGDIVVNGTSENPVIFTRDDPSSTYWRYWDGVRIYDDGVFNIDYLEVYGANYAIYADHCTDGEINHSHFEENYNAFYGNYSEDITIQNCDYINNRYGIKLYYTSDVNLVNNNIQDNYYGMYFNRAQGYFSSCDIIENYYGIYITNISSTSSCMRTMELNGFETYEVNNTISDNGLYGVCITSTGYVDLGTYIRTGFGIFGGFNAFILGSSTYHIKNYSSYTIPAEVNSWSSLTNSGNVDTDPTISSLGYQMSKSVSGAFSFASEPLRLAHINEYEEKYQ